MKQVHRVVSPEYVVEGSQRHQAIQIDALTGPMATAEVAVPRHDGLEVQFHQTLYVSVQTHQQSTDVVQKPLHWFARTSRPVAGRRSGRIDWLTCAGHVAGRTRGIVLFPRVV